MKKTVQIFLFLPILALLISPENSSAVTKVSRTMNVIEFFGGSSMPVGTRNGLPDFEFFANNASVDVDAKDIYDNSFHFGFNYGQLRSAHYLFSIGFRYTKHNVKDTIPLISNTFVTVDSSVSHNQYDVEFNLNYYLMDLMNSSFAPYGGFGLRAGLSSITQKGYESEHIGTLGLCLNFGADIRLWSSQDARSIVTLSSVNSYEIYGSNDRPNYLNIGGAVKYFFRP